MCIYIYIYICSDLKQIYYVNNKQLFIKHGSFKVNINEYQQTPYTNGYCARVRPTST